MLEGRLLGGALVPQAVQEVLLAVDVESQLLELVAGSLLLVLDLKQLLHFLDLLVPQRFYVLLHLPGKIKIRINTVQYC